MGKREDGMGGVVGCGGVGAWGVLGGAGGRAGHVARLGRATRRPRPPAGAALAPTGRPAPQPRPGLATATCAGPTTPSMNVAARLGHDGVRHPWRTVLLVQAMCMGCLTPMHRHMHHARCKASGVPTGDIASPGLPAGPGRPVGGRGAPVGGRGRLVARPSRATWPPRPRRQARAPQEPNSPEAINDTHQRNPEEPHGEHPGRPAPAARF